MYAIFAIYDIYKYLLTLFLFFMLEKAVSLDSPFDRDLFISLMNINSSFQLLGIGQHASGMKSLIVLSVSTML